MTGRELLVGAAAASRLLASLALLACSVRVGLLLSDVALQAPRPRAPHAPAAGRKGPIPRATTAPGSPEEPRGAPGKSVRMTLSVSVGPPRSEVYVSGRLLGQTPLITEVSCKEGLPIKVEVVPEEAPLVRFQRSCRMGTLRLTEPDPPGAEFP